MTGCELCGVGPEDECLDSCPSRFSGDELRPDQWLAGFRRAYVGSKAMEATTWRGLPVGWCPLDLWTLAEIEAETKPYWWIETDTLYGGLALWLGALQDVEQSGRTISVGDRVPKNLPVHRRVTFLRESSYDPRIVGKVADVVGREDRTMGQAPTVVIVTGAEDLQALDLLVDLWAPLVTPGSYLVVDSRLPGADDVTDQYLVEDGSGRVYAFAEDQDRARHGLTFCRWLRRREIPG